MMIKLKYSIVIFLLLNLGGCANAPCFDVSVSGRLPTDGWGNARGEVCIPPPPEEKDEKSEKNG
jgi:hypothetical protein